MAKPAVPGPRAPLSHRVCGTAPCAHRGARSAPGPDPCAASHGPMWRGHRACGVWGLGGGSASRRSLSLGAKSHRQRPERVTPSGPWLTN